jgi:hypothetical protein
MSENPDQELVPVMLDLAPYLCVSKIRPYFTAKGTGAPQVSALWVAPYVSTGSLEAESHLVDGVATFDPAGIPVVHKLNWLWRDHEQWLIDYHEGPQQIRQAFPSKDEAVAFLKNRIRSFWEQKLANP